MLSTLTRHARGGGGRGVNQHSFLSTTRTPCLNTQQNLRQVTLASFTTARTLQQHQKHLLLSGVPKYRTSSGPGQQQQQQQQQQQRAWLTTTTTPLRQYEKHHDHVNIKKPTPSNPAAVSATASVADQDLDDPHNQQAIDAIDLNPDVELKLRYNTRDTFALLEKDQLGNGVDEEEVVISSTTTTATTEVSGGGEGGQSVLLEDKQRSEEEFSWFVDKTYTTATEEGEEHKVSSQDFVPLWKRNARGPHHPTKHHKHSTKSTADTDKDKGKDDLQNAPAAIRGLVRMLEHERARNVTVMDMRQKCDWTDWMVIAEGVSERHVGNVADEVYSALKKMLPKTSPPLMEGRSTPDWVVIDTGAIIVHFMTHGSRKERNLEGLWGAVKDPLKLKDAEEISWEDVQAKLTESWNTSDHAAKTTHGKSKKGGGAAGAGHGTRRSRRGDEDISLEEVVKG